MHINLYKLQRIQSQMYVEYLYRFWLPSLLFVLVASELAGADDPIKITFEDHVKTIFREHCTSCHNANDKKSGLALDTYQAVLTGGSGGEVVSAGDLDSSRLYGLTAHKEQPYMPPNQDMIPQAKVDLLKVWIEQGMPENSGSAIQKPKANAAALGMTSLARPEGAPPMPVSMLKQTPLFTPRAATISALAASPWSPLVAVGGQMQVTLYHSETGELQGIIPFPEGEPQSITFSRDGRLILIAGGRHSASGCAALHDIATGNRIARVGDELDIVFGADISDDNQLIAMAGPQKMVRVFETLTGNLKYEQKKHTDWIYCVRFSPDGLLLATADRASGLVVWETQTGRLFQELPGHKGEIRSLAWRPDSQALVSGSLDGTLKLWDMNEGKLIKSWDAHGGGVAAVATCNDGTMASTGRDNKVKVWDGAGNALGEMPALTEAGHEIAITVDSKQVIAGDWSGKVRMWQRATPAIEKVLLANPIPLEQSLAGAQHQLNLAQALYDTVQAEWKAAQSQQTASQKILSETQTQITSTTTELQSVTEQSAQLKLQSDAIVQQLSAKASEYATAVAAKMERSNQLNAAMAAKKSADDAIAMLKAQRAVEGSDVASIDEKIANNSVQSLAQTAAITKFQTELQSLQSKCMEIEKQNLDIKSTFDARNGEFVAAANRVQELSATKMAAERKLESTTAAVQMANDAFVAAQSKLDAANASTTAIRNQVNDIQSDIAKFTSFQTEIAAKKVTIEQRIASSNAELEPADSVVLATKQELETVSAEVGRLEQELVALQAKMASETAKRVAIQTELKAKQQAANAIRDQVLISEQELANTSIQQQLFEKAYSKR